MIRKLHKQKENPISKTEVGKINNHVLILKIYHKNVQVGNDQEMAQSERKSHSKNQGGEK